MWGPARMHRRRWHLYRELPGNDVVDSDTSTGDSKAGRGAGPTVLADTPGRARFGRGRRRDHANGCRHGQPGHRGGQRRNRQHRPAGRGQRHDLAADRRHQSDRRISHPAGGHTGDAPAAVRTNSRDLIDGRPNGHPQLAAYNATMWGVIGLAKSAALEVAKDGITINVVCPTTTQTPMVQPAGGDDIPDDLVRRMMRANPIPQPWLQPEDVSRGVLYLVTDPGVITGSDLEIGLGGSARMHRRTPRRSLVRSRPDNLDKRRYGLCVCSAVLDRCRESHPSSDSAAL